MTDSFLQLVLSNLIFSAGLLTIGLVLIRLKSRPQLAHLFCFLSLLMLLTPPLAVIPIEIVQPELIMTPLSEIELPPAGPVILSATLPQTAMTFKEWLLLVWATGSLLFLIWTSAKVISFQRLISLGSRSKDLRLDALLEDVRKKMKLRTKPILQLTSANISPLLWTIGRQPRIVIPSYMPDRLDDKELVAILAHEMAHLKRRDHYIRFVEWIASILFWWNPVVWYGRKKMREQEELCCDALVLSTQEISPRSYADSLYRIINLLIQPADRPPLLASEINREGFLDTRFDMILSKKNTLLSPNNSKWLFLLAAVAILPIGMSCKDAIPLVEEEPLPKINTRMAPEASLSSITLNGERVWTSTEIPPSLIGGFDQIRNAIIYPQRAKEAGIEGKVFIQFIIDKSGRARELQVVKSLGFGLDAEAERIVSKLKFKPGFQDGRPANVRFSLPITFSLKAANRAGMTNAEIGAAQKGSSADPYNLLYQENGKAPDLDEIAQRISKVWEKGVPTGKRIEIELLSLEEAKEVAKLYTEAFIDGHIDDELRDLRDEPDGQVEGPSFLEADSSPSEVDAYNQRRLETLDVTFQLQSLTPNWDSLSGADRSRLVRIAWIKKYGQKAKSLGDSGNESSNKSQGIEATLLSISDSLGIDRLQAMGVAERISKEIQTASRSSGPPSAKKAELTGNVLRQAYELERNKFAELGDDAPVTRETYILQGHKDGLANAIIAREGKILVIERRMESLKITDALTDSKKAVHLQEYADELNNLRSEVELFFKEWDAFGF